MFGCSQSSRSVVGGKVTTMFKHGCHFSPGGGSNPAWGILVSACYWSVKYDKYDGLQTIKGG